MKDLWLIILHRLLSTVFNFLCSWHWHNIKTAFFKICLNFPIHFAYIASYKKNATLYLIKQYCYKYCILCKHTLYYFELKKNVYRLYLLMAQTSHYWIIWSMYHLYPDGHLCCPHLNIQYINEISLAWALVFIAVKRLFLVAMKTKAP